MKIIIKGIFIIYYGGFALSSGRTGGIMSSNSSRVKHTPFALGAGGVFFLRGCMGGDAVG